MARAVSVAFAAFLLAAPSLTEAQVIAELDSYWAEATRTVEEGDFAGYASLYHPDAVLVMQGRGSVPIQEALDGWKQLFLDTQEGDAAADVEFRFTERLNDATTAHETGIFRYVFEPQNGEPSVSLVHFEALLVKRDGRWLMLMEYQQDPATEEEWAAAG
jgi:uncharacterized protein (TIGR02246 family)